MISLLPSDTVCKLTKIDFNLLSVAVSDIVYLHTGVEFRRSIKIHKNRKGLLFDSYSPGENIIMLQLDSERSIKCIIMSILHEVRHWMQDVLYGVVFDEATYPTDTYKEYWNNTPEKDARAFEKFGTEVVSMYRSLIRIEKKMKAKPVIYSN